MLETTIDTPDRSAGANMDDLPNRLAPIHAGTRPMVPAPRWLQAIAHLDPKYGGLSAAVPNLGRAVALQQGHSISIAGFCLPKEDYMPAACGSDLKVEHWPLSRLEWLKNRKHTAGFRKTLSTCSGVHIHGLWQQNSAIAGPMARELGIPYVVSAHGMLESWAFAHKRWKKALYMSLSEGANLRGAACLHALTQAEAGDYRRLGLSNPIAVIPNGVTIPAHRSPDRFFNEFPALREKQIVLFLGRVHYKKGLDILCRAWAQCKRDAGVHLVIAGPDFENTRERIEELVDSLNIRQSVIFTGMLRDQMKWSALAAAKTFVLPSYSEGLSVSVLEAMGFGVPVLISEHCNLPEVQQQNCGWVVPAETAALGKALEEAISNGEARNREIGANGTRLVAERYSWPAIGSQMNSLYSWLEGGSLPTDVDIQFHNEVAR